jgi:cytochrome c-type biogenesis protein CcmH
MKQAFFHLKMNKLVKALSALGLALLAGLLLAGSVLAQEPTPVSVTDDEVNAVAKRLYCPVCENVPLDVCGTQACAQWRQVVREKLEAGYNENEVREYFANYYGDRALSMPPPRGLNLVVYVLPPLFFLGGVFVLYRTLRNMHRSEKIVVPPPQPEEDPYLSKFEEQLKHLEEDEKR